MVATQTTKGDTYTSPLIYLFLKASVHVVISALRLRLGQNMAF